MYGLTAIQAIVFYRSKGLIMIETNASNPLISVIVPVYQMQDYLAECVDSILAQSYQVFELLLFTPIPKLVPVYGFVSIKTSSATTLPVVRLTRRILTKATVLPSAFLPFVMLIPKR